MGYRFLYDLLFIFTYISENIMYAKFITTCILVCTCLTVQAQADGYEPLAIRVLAIDTSVVIAKRFCEKMVELAPGYKLAFIDNEKRHYVRYVYKNEKNETLRIDYAFDVIEQDAEQKGAKRAIVNYQTISGELQIVTNIYNFLFSSNLSADRIMTSSTTGSPMTFNGRNYEYTLMPDDYEPGYWVLTFRR
jgi:hypothetical protein